MGTPGVIVRGTTGLKRGPGGSILRFNAAGSASCCCDVVACLPFGATSQVNQNSYYWLPCADPEYQWVSGIRQIASASQTATFPAGSFVSSSCVATRTIAINVLWAGSPSPASGPASFSIDPGSTVSFSLTVERTASTDPGYPIGTWTVSKTYTGAEITTPVPGVGSAYRSGWPLSWSFGSYPTLGNSRGCFPWALPMAVWWNLPPWDSSALTYGRFDGQPPPSNFDRNVPSNNTWKAVEDWMRFVRPLYPPNVANCTVQGVVPIGTQARLTVAQSYGGYGAWSGSSTYLDLPGSFFAGHQVTSTWNQSLEPTGVCIGPPA